MNPNVVSEEYIALQQALLDKHKELRKIIIEKLPVKIKREELNHELPVLPQLEKSPVPADLFLFTFKEIESVLIDQHSLLEEELNKLTADLTVLEITPWIKHAITFNTSYFQKIAEKYEVSEWLPQFLAEQSLRPFMQVIAEQCLPFIDEFEVMGTCPCCGEPHRLAKLEGNEQKYLFCPRCETEWKQRKVACVHCGDDRPNHLFYIHIKEDDQAKLEICETCNNYLKLIETTQMPKGKSAALLDLETIHLDFVAQEEGFGEET